MSRRGNSFSRRAVTDGLRFAGAAAAVWCAASCNGGIDTTRKAPPKATLGDDLYGVLCDRVGASSLAEDLTGASYHAVCHYTSDGKYGDSVDTSVLPKATGEANARTRELGVAKVEAMARRRSELIQAFNAIFPDIQIDDVTTPSETDTIRLHDALMGFTKGISPLYETNPFEAMGEPLLPSQTRSLARLFKAIVDSDEAREIMAKFAGRKGYRPSNVGLGAVRPALAYKGLRGLTSSAIGLLGPGGTAAPQLQQLLRVVQEDLKTPEVIVSPLPAYTVDAATAQPNRPRSALEFTRALMLTEDKGFNAANDPPRYIAARDRRGFVMPLLNGGSLPAPFVDVDGDGLADADAFGRFIDNNGLPLKIDPPFVVPGLMAGPTDDFGRPEAPLYQYVDTSRTMLAGVLRSTVPLVDSLKIAPDGDPDAWRSEHESLMYALAGAYVLYGGREEAQYDFANSTIVPAGEACSGCVSYRRFRGEDSPLPDLIHAAGQIFADKDSDGILLGLMDLIESHEADVARLLGAALKVREIALAHDALAAQGKEPLAILPYETPIWDEVAGLMAKITAKPGLTRRLVEAFADPSLVTPVGGSLHVGDTLSKFVTYRDELTYNTDDINGPTVNLTVGGGSTASPQSPVDPMAPRQGKNRSDLQRSLQTIHDAAGVKACNKKGAQVHAKVGPISLTWPLFDGSYDACELFQFDDLATFYLDTLLPVNHPKRSELKILAGDLDAMMNFFGIFVDPGDLFEASSGISGLTLFPDPPALNRLVFFGASSDVFKNMPDLDTNPKNALTNTFVSGLIEPVPTSVCPLKPNGTRECATMADLLRIRGANTIFLWERYGFYEYLKPLVAAFANTSCSADLSSCDVDDKSGEQLFVDLINILNRYWPDKTHGPECDTSGDAASNPKFCTESGVNLYEPILAEAFASDLIPALVEFSRIAKQISVITVKRGPEAGKIWTGAEVLERTAKILFNPDYASSMKMADRKGSSMALWADGKTATPVTGFTLFSDALHKIDTRFDSACSCSGLEGQALNDCNNNYDTCTAEAKVRQGQWKRARSQLVDAFLAVDGEGPGAKFKNPATPKLLAATLRVLREQINANCPDREIGPDYACPWARKELGDKLERTLSGPVFAALMDLQEALRANETARRELEKFLGYILSNGSANDAFQSMLASGSDVMQSLADDASMAPIFKAIAGAAAPEDDPAGPGAADTAVKVLKAMAGDDFDKYHVLDYILPGLVTPMNGGKGLSPIEVIMEAVSDVNRIDSASQDPLVPDDYKAMMDSVKSFMDSKTRGLEQIYSIVQNRTKE